MYAHIFIYICEYACEMTTYICLGAYNHMTHRIVKRDSWKRKHFTQVESVLWLVSYASASNNTTQIHIHMWCITDQWPCSILFTFTIHSHIYIHMHISIWAYNIYTCIHTYIYTCPIYIYTFKEMSILLDPQHIHIYIYIYTTARKQKKEKGHINTHA